MVQVSPQFGKVFLEKQTVVLFLKMQLVMVGLLDSQKIAPPADNKLDEYGLKLSIGPYPFFIVKPSNTESAPSPLSKWKPRRRAESLA